MSAPFLQYPLQQLSEFVAHTAPLAAILLVASVWRGLVIVLSVAIALKLLPKLSAEIRSAVWLCVLVIIVVSPLLSAKSLHGTASLASGALNFDPRWSYVLASIWVLFSTWRLLQLALSALQLRALAQRSTHIMANANVRRILAASTRRIQLCTSQEVDRPSVVGFFHPRILLPEGLTEKLDASELEQIVLHELEHLRRRDDWTNLLQKVSLALFPLHPVVLWLDRRLCVERELACDDGVLRATASRKSYAACLTNLAEQSLLRRRVTLALGALGSFGARSEIAKRVYRILREPEVSMGRTQSRMATGAVVAGVLAGAFALAHTPHLVSFAPATTAAELAASPESASPATLPPHMGATRSASATPHEVLTKAVVTPRATSAIFRVTPRTPSVKRTMQPRRTTPPSVNKPQQSPLYRLAAWQDTDMPTPHFALAVQQDSHFAYAAVPVQGGWLIIQI